MPSRSTEDEHPGIAIAFRGLADPYRLRVFAALQELEASSDADDTEARSMPIVIEGIVRHTNISPSSVEHHLMELRRAGLVVIGEGGGGQATVSIDQDRLSLVKHVLDTGDTDLSE
jgi:DNA-binding transcriptional ArsR family regulator